MLPTKRGQTGDVAGLDDLHAGEPMSVSEVRRAVVASPRWALFLRALWVALIPGSLLFAGMQVSVHASHGMIGADSHAYWLAARDPSSWYTRPPASWDAYLYSPAFAQVLWPLARAPWHVFQVLWAMGQAGVLAWLLAPLGIRKALTLAPLFVTELLLGNLYIFFAAALVLSIHRTPGLLSLPILTKIAPGCVGIWWLVRREWRLASQCVAATVLIIVVSAALAPDAWWNWVQFLVANAATSRGGTAGIRLAGAVLVVIWAARRGRAWLLAPALILGCPVIGGYGPLAILSALPRLLRWEPRHALPMRRQQGEAAIPTDDCPTSVAL